MKLAVFGGTGRTGLHFVRQALEAGHEVTALARSPSRMNVAHPRLTVIRGDVQDASCIEATVAGADVVVSLLGPTRDNPPFTVAQGTSHILDAMRKYGVRRIVLSAGAGVGDANDSPRLINHLISFLLKVMAKGAYEDMSKTAQVVRASDLDWVMVRVPMLTEAPAAGSIRVGWVGKGTGPRLSREDMASFVLQQVTADDYIRQAPVISN